MWHWVDLDVGRLGIQWAELVVPMGRHGEGASRRVGVQPLKIRLSGDRNHERAFQILVQESWDPLNIVLSQTLQSS